MGKPAAKKQDIVQATDIHIIIIPPGTPTPLPHPFIGMLDKKLIPKVKIMGKPAAVKGSEASAKPPHIPQGGPFQSPPKNKGTIKMGSGTVKIGGKPAARLNEMVETCNDPSPLPVGKVIAMGTVFIGG